MKKAWVMYSARIPRLAVLLGSSWLFVTGNVLADCVDFSDAELLIPETGATTVRSGDIDGDGDQDLITANRTGAADGTGSVSIFLNNGDGTFAAPDHLPLLPGDEYPRSMAVIDLDDDGDLDLVTANWLSDSVTIFVNDGSGDFELASLSTFQYPTAVDAADLNGDALPEIIVTVNSANGAAAVIYRNLGRNSFGLFGSYAIFNEPRSITSADLDDDGDLDLVIACRSANALALLINNGSGGFAPAVEIGVGNKPRGTTAGDFDGDGDLDLAVAMFADPVFPGECWILRNEGNADFVVDAVLGAGEGPHAVRHGDLDGDCDLDIIVANVGTDQQTVWLNDGAGQFLWQQDVQTLSSSADVWLVDLDGDDRLDIAATAPTDRVSVLLNQTEAVGCSAAVPAWRNVADCPLGEGDCQGAAWGDFDKDGRVDLYVTSWGEPNRLFRNLGGHLFSEVQSVALGPPGDSLSGRAVWGDCDNDGDLDLYVAQTLGCEFILKTSSAFVVATNGEPLSMANRQAHAAAWADYDEDGLIDLYIASSLGASRLLHNDGMGVFTDASDRVTGDDGLGRDVAWADYDNDGDQDLYLAKGDSAGGTLDPESRTNRLLRNDGSGAFSDVTSGALLAQTHSRGVAWGDYDNDGDLDLYVAAVPVDGQNGENMLLRNDGNDSFSDVTTGLLGYAGATNSCSWVDYDNDGDLDLFLVNLFEPNLLLQNDGVGNFVDVASGPLLGGADETRSAAWADYDEDGDLDAFLACGPDTGNILARNELNSGNHWLEVRLVGTRSNRAALGARLTLEAGGVSQIREIQSGSGYLAQHQLVAHFGLGTTTTLDQLTIRWPSGQMQSIQDIQDMGVDALVTVVEPCDPGIDCPDCNENGISDVADLIDGTSNDFNWNGVPDECQLPDLNGDGVVDVIDLLEVILQWGPCPAPPSACPADLDGSGSVDVPDLIALIVFWS